MIILIQIGRLQSWEPVNTLVWTGDCEAAQLNIVIWKQIPDEKMKTLKRDIVLLSIFKQIFESLVCNFRSGLTLQKLSGGVGKTVKDLWTNESTHLHSIRTTTSRCTTCGKWRISFYRLLILRKYFLCTLLSNNLTDFSTQHHLSCRVFCSNFLIKV